MSETATETTAYMILRFMNVGGDQIPPHYELVGRNLTARGAEGAIRKYAEGAGDKASGLYVAVPRAPGARSR